jgi:hypothetical protein
MSRSRTNPPRDRALAGSSPVLGAALLARIYEFNLDYLELLACEHASPNSAAQLQYLPPGLGVSAATLSMEARRALAAAPFTLYSLGFEDHAFWLAACAGETSSVEQRYAPAAAPSIQGPFCESALLYAWYVVSTAPLAARLLYAMNEGAARCLAAAPLWRLKRIANDFPALLTPRWPTNPGFWPDLVRFAAANDRRRLRTAQSLGHQLIAAELECAAAHASGRRAVTQPLRSPRLRARKVRFEVRRAMKVDS